MFGIIGAVGCGAQTYMTALSWSTVPSAHLPTQPPGNEATRRRVTNRQGMGGGWVVGGSCCCILRQWWRCLRVRPRARARVYTVHGQHVWNSQVGAHGQPAGDEEHGPRAPVNLVPAYVPGQRHGWRGKWRAKATVVSTLTCHPLACTDERSAAAAGYGCGGRPRQRP